MSKQTATGESRVIAEGFIAYRENDQSEGRRGESEIGRFTELQEAIAAARGQGVQGSNGSVGAYRILHYSGGAVALEATRLIARRRVPQGGYAVGWLDLREYEFGVRPGTLGPVRKLSGSILSQETHAVPEADSSSIVLLEADEVRSQLTADSTAVGAWRKSGETRWRSEFSADELEDRLPAPLRSAPQGIQL